VAARAGLGRAGPRPPSTSSALRRARVEPSSCHVREQSGDIERRDGQARRTGVAVLLQGCLDVPPVLVVVGAEPLGQFRPALAGLRQLGGREPGQSEQHGRGSRGRRGPVPTLLVPDPHPDDALGLRVEVVGRSVGLLVRSAQQREAVPPLLGELSDEPLGVARPDRQPEPGGEPVEGTLVVAGVEEVEAARVVDPDAVRRLRPQLLVQRDPLLEPPNPQVELGDAVPDVALPSPTGVDGPLHALDSRVVLPAEA
jgi:hypothetical protein